MECLQEHHFWLEFGLEFLIFSLIVVMHWTVLTFQRAWLSLTRTSFLFCGRRETAQRAHWSSWVLSAFFTSINSYLIRRRTAANLSQHPQGMSTRHIERATSRIRPAPQILKPPYSRNTQEGPQKALNNPETAPLFLHRYRNPTCQAARLRTEFIFGSEPAIHKSLAPYIAPHDCV